MRYPNTPTVDHVDTLHGRRVPDPYRWLENLDAPETRAWIEEQNRLTDELLRKSPRRASIEARMTELWDHEKFGVPWKKGGRYFFLYNDGLKNQHVLLTMDGLGAEPRVLLDPNGLSEDGTVALVQAAVSPDGRLLAYGLASAGSDWQEWKVRDVRTGEDTGDHIRWVKFSEVSWAADGGGFFYSRYDAPEEGDEYKGANYYHKLFFHRMGTSQSEDVLVYERPDRKDWGFAGRVTDDGRYLVISVWRGTQNENAVFYKELTESSEVAELLAEWDADYTFIDNDGPIFYFRTDRGAPLGRVVAVDVTRPGDVREVLPESEHKLESVSRVGGRFFAVYLEHAHSRVEVFDNRGAPAGRITLPGLGTVLGFQGRDEDTETFYLFTSFATPGTVYRYDVGSGESSVFRRPGISFDPADYIADQVFFESRDGARVPLFLVRRRDVEPNGEVPTYLYGYGGFNIAVTPEFSVPHLVWMERGGLLAIAGLRGGGEYGKEWHEAGMKSRKQNVFDDFMAAAEWLTANGWTSAARIAISGRSNGGLLTGACLTQRPDLFGACAVGVGVLDMLRFHRFTIGWAWMSEYGSPDDPGEFEAIHSYSPYHNIGEGESYPATIVYTGDHDDRVFPGHSFKFAARLQAAQAGAAPVVARIETRAGHGMGKPTSKLIQEWVDVMTFLSDAVDANAP